MIYRDKNKQTNFAKDNRISLQAKGLLAYIFSCEDERTFNCLKIQEETKAKRTVVENVIKELENLGYAKRISTKIGGKYSSSIDFYEAPKISCEINKPLGYLYVVKMGDYYKIGTSKTPNTRLKEFTKLPFELETVICECVFNYQEIESELHNKFYEKNKRGEWFVLDKQDVEYIKDYLSKFNLQRIYKEIRNGN